MVLGLRKIATYISRKKVPSKYKMYKEIATAGAFVSNFSLYKIPKSKKQIFIQTWHGDKAFKKVLYDATPERKKFDVSVEIPGYCDYAIAGSEYGKKQYESAFRYKGKIIMAGTPRNDRLFNYNASESKKIKEQCIYTEGQNSEKAMY